MMRYVQGKPLESLPNTTCIGALMQYITTSSPINFQPMNANYGIIGCDKTFVDKSEKKQYILDTSITQINKFKEKLYGKSI